MSLEAPRGFRGVFRTDAKARAVYSEAAGIGRMMPTAVAVPQSPEDVATLVRWARAEHQPLVPRGSGSSMAGGAIGTGVIVDLSRLRGVGEADAASRCIRTEVGVLRGEVDRHAAQAHLRFPVDPSSGEFCTVGGMVATNAAGPHSLLHGPMRPWVLSLDCVFDDGTQATIRRGVAAPSRIPAIARFSRTVGPRLISDPPPTCRVLKNSSGYAIDRFARTQDLVDLLVGSEGTLAIFTAVELALIPRANATGTLLVAFDDLEVAVQAAVAARERGAAACELLDRTFLTIAAGAGTPLPVPPDSEAALLVEVEASDDGDAAERVTALSVLVRRMGATVVVVSSGMERESELWSLRHAASPAIAKLDASLRSMQFIEDAAVPPERLADYVRGVRAILEDAETRGVIFGHAGDAHVHVNPLVDVRRPDWRARVDRILADVTELVATLGGTLSGEHGDGRLRAPLLDRVWPAETLARFAEIKACFDPTGILNPGVKVARPGQHAVDAVKYDPKLPDVPPAARSALATVERERGYSRFRLELL